MKKALILGIKGTYGSHIARALAQQGWQIKAMVKDPAKTILSQSDVEIVQGNVANIEDIRQAANGVELMVYAISPANYDWRGKALPWLDNASKVAEENKLTVVFPGNVYVFDPEDGPVFNEDSAMRPVSQKGKTRLAMEQRLFQASQQGARVIIVRAGDFIAPDSTSAWMQHLIKPNKTGYTVTLPGPADLPHSWAYVPDLVKSVAELVEKRDTLAAFETFHFKGHRESMNDIVESIARVTGKPVKMVKFPWWALRLASPFSVLMHGLVEMSYLWRREISMSDKKLESVIAHRPQHTPMSQVLIDAGFIGSETPRKDDTKVALVE